MIRKSTCALALLVLVSTSTSIAFAQVELAHGVTWTDLSGTAGTAVTDVGAGSTVHAVNRIRVAESSDVPCFLGVYKSEINRSGDAIFAAWDECPGLNNPLEEAGFPDDSGLHVYGVNVCTNSLQTRLKGVMLFGGVVVSDGTFFPAGVPAYFVRPNCNTWHSAVFCPAGQVASKVRIHHTGGVHGLSLGCRVVTPQ